MNVFQRSGSRKIGGWFFALLAMMVLPVCAGAAQKAAKGGPKIVIPQPTFEAGKVVEGDQITHTFIIKNKGDKDLVIKSVKPG